MGDKYKLEGQRCATPSMKWTLVMSRLMVKNNAASQKGALGKKACDMGTPSSFGEGWVGRVRTDHFFSEVFLCMKLLKEIS